MVKLMGGFSSGGAYSECTDRSIAVTRRWGVVLPGLPAPRCSRYDTLANWAHGGGFSLDASVRIEGSDRPGLERLLRHCARPAFALGRWREIDAEHLIYESIKPGPGGLKK